MRWWQSSAPGSELQPVPWLAPQVVARLEEIVQPEFDVLEHGSGGSTLWFSARCASVFAVENDVKWQAVVQKLAPGNVSMSNDIIPDQPYDLLLIDGEPIKTREWWIRKAPSLVKPGGWVVLDNANRPEYATEREALQKIAASFETFDCNEKIDENGRNENYNRTNFLVTEIYRMPEKAWINLLDEKKAEPDESREQPKPRKPRRKVSRRSTGGGNTPAE